MMKSSVYSLALTAYLFFLAAPALAHKFPWTPIVTCTTGCTLCELFHTGQHLINFLTFTIAIPIVVIGILIGGTLIMISGGNENLFSRGKEALTAAIIGFIIIMGAWLVINTIIVVLNSGADIDLRDWFYLRC